MALFAYNIGILQKIYSRGCLIEPWKFSLEYKKSFELPISSANKWKNCILYI